MNSPGPWGTEDVDSLAWHDVHVHGSCLATFSERRGTADLVLDIDDILTWESSRMASSSGHASPRWCSLASSASRSLQLTGKRHQHTAHADTAVSRRSDASRQPDTARARGLAARRS